MAKDKLTEYSATNASNDVIGDISVAEGMLPSAVNNALREQMTHLKNFSDGTDAIDALAVDNLKLDGNTISSTDTNGDITIDPDGTGDTIIASGNVGIGKSTSIADRVHIEKSGANCLLSVARTIDGAAGRLVMQHTDTVGALQTTGSVPLTFGTADTERMRIASDGTVGINNSISDSFYAGGNNLVVGSGSGSEGITIYGGAESNLFFADGTASADNLVGRIEYSHGSDNMLFYTNNSYAMRINASGVLSVGGSNATAKFNVVGQGGSNVQLQNNIATGTGGVVQIGFINDNGLVGSIQTSGSATSYVTSSDARLKENVTYTWDATTRLKQLKPARFNFIADPDTVVDGFIAHELEAVVPESVTGTKDAVEVWTSDEVDNGDAPDGTTAGDDKLNSDGNTIPIMQGVDQSKIVPLLVKTIQELEARITALEA